MKNMNDENISPNGDQSASSQPAPKQDVDNKAAASSTPETPKQEQVSQPQAASSAKTEPQPQVPPPSSAQNAYQTTQHQPQHASGQPTYQQPYHQPHQQPHQQPYQQPYQQQGVHRSPASSSASTRKPMGGAKVFLFGFLGAALACIIALSGFGIFATTTGQNMGGTVIGSTQSTDVNASAEDATLPEAVAKKTLPSVASINVFANANSGGGGGQGTDSTLVQSSLGSGVVLSEDGYIITNYHVIEGADSLTVTVGGADYDATVVGTDPSSDLAVIKAEKASGLTPIEIGSSSNLTIGEWVMTLGSPFGLEQSVATGIVSATSRSQILESESGTSIYANMIQTDAAINPGNSGGALVDSDGKLIGINTLISSSSGDFSGVGFAIPVDYAIDIAQQIMDGKTPTHAQLGVSLSTVNSDVAARYGLAVDKGAYVSQVTSGSGAANAGIEVGDIITKFNDNEVESASDLMLDIRSMNPNDKVTIEINRNGQTETKEVTLGSDGNSTQSSLSKGLNSLFGSSYSGEGQLDSAA